MENTESLDRFDRVMIPNLKPMPRKRKRLNKTSQKNDQKSFPSSFPRKVVIVVVVRRLYSRVRITKTLQF